MMFVATLDVKEFVFQELPATIVTPFVVDVIVTLLQVSLSRSTIFAISLGFVEANSALKEPSVMTVHA